MSSEVIKHGDKILAIVARTNDIDEELKFLSPNEFPLQVGVHNRTEGFSIAAHDHVPFDQLNNIYPQEMFFIIKGKVEIGIYHEDKKVNQVILSDGDSIILNSGHDFKFLEKTKMIEVKQGPYRGKEKEKRYINSEE